MDFTNRTMTLIPESEGIIQDLDDRLRQSELEPTLRSLVNHRISQINGLASPFASEEIDRSGEIDPMEEELQFPDDIRSAAYITDRERVALEWVDRLTPFSPTSIDRKYYWNALEYFTMDELAELILMIVAINAFHRVQSSMVEVHSE